MRPYLKVASVVGLALLWQGGMLGTNSAWAQKKPSSVHTPNVHANVQQKDIEFQLSDEVKVRRKFPPLQYDDKGKVRKATAAELTQLKGPDPKQPGYSADIYDLKAGQVVQLQLWKQKDDSKPADKAGADKPKADAKNADKDGKGSWVQVGTLAGKVKSVPNSSKNSSRKLVVTIDTTTLGGQHRTQTSGKGKTTIPDVEVRLVMILTQDASAKEAPAKKNN